ncbi:MAG: aldehyde dehydrogenase family protein [Syntrophobacteraceae bacterium]|nr:aldehyde dehydrogenase family protein [Syntrophobacteraceae bacterium]
MAEKYKALIGGEWVEAAGGETTTVINPANGQVIATVPKCGIEEVNAAVSAAAAAFPEWAAKPVGERSKLLLKLSQLIMANQESIAKLETMEHGSPIRKTMNFDVPLCAEQLEYFAGVARGVTGETLPVGPWCMSMTVRQPLGVIGLITPWNFPALMLIWKLGAALVMGNTCIVKPPSIAPLTALKLGELAMEAGIPKGVVNVITGPGGTVGEALVEHPGVAKIGFTGDTATGKRIMKVASDTVKQLGLELGGKNAFIVLEDADVDSAVEGAVFGAYFNSGQVCAAASRFYVHESLYDEFAEKFVAASKTLKMGDPTDFATVLGPVAYKAHRDKIDTFVEKAKKSSAKLLLGGERPADPALKDGYFVSPTIFGDCTNDMDLMRHEIFGPVVGLCRFKTPDEAIALANDTPYGLSASIWTKDTRAGLVMASQINAGTVWINEHLIIFCETPWGGCKESGWGKDLSTMVLDEYTMTKHIYVDLTGQPAKPWYAILK